MKFQQIRENYFLVSSKYNYIYNAQKHKLTRIPSNINGLCLYRLLEKTNLGPQQNTFTRDSKIAYLEFNLSEECNMKCTYCIRQTVKNRSQIRLSKENIDSFVDELHQLKEMLSDKVKVQFYGGEPLLQIDTIKYIVNSLKSLDRSFSFCTTTNGTLFNEDKVAILRHLGVRCSISVDGVGKTNDRTRIMKDNTSSFSKIASNIDQFNSSGIIVGLVCVYTDQSLPEVKDLVTFAQSKKLPLTLSPIRMIDEDWSPQRIRTYVSNIFQIYDMFIENSYQMHGTVFDFLLTNKSGLFRNTLNPYNRCAAGANSSICINPDGYFTKCHIGSHKSKYYSMIDFLNSIEYISCLNDEFVKRECSSCHLNILCATSCIYDLKICKTSCKIKKEMFKQLVKRYDKIMESAGEKRKVSII